MLFINRNKTNPWFNIAAEEYILKSIDDDIVMLWRSSPSVIIGKHQNTLNEVNTQLVSELNIPVIRRISGGGTVYHDEGNLNYSLITRSSNKSTLVNFNKATEPIISFLKNNGIHATFEGKSNLRISGLKFSGNSAHVYKNKVLHHGTLLFNTDLDLLNKIITPPKQQITDKAVQSIRTSVTNISEQTNVFSDITDFEHKLKEYFISFLEIKNIRELTSDEIQKIDNLANSKYKLWEWNYGYSPSYSFAKSYRNTTLILEITKSKITKAEIIGDIPNKFEICSFLIDKTHSEFTFRDAINTFDLTENEADILLKTGGF